MDVSGEGFPAVLTDRLRWAMAVIGTGYRMLLTALAEFDESGEWRDDMASGAADWVCTAFGIGRADASRLVRTARALRDLPAVVEELSSGVVSYAHVEALTRFAVTADDEYWARELRGMTVAQVRNAAKAARLEDESGPQRAFEDRKFVWREDVPNDRLRFWGQMPLTEGRRLVGVLSRLVDEAHSSLRPLEQAALAVNGETRGTDTFAPGSQALRPTVAQAYSDALTELVETRLPDVAPAQKAVTLVVAAAESFCHDGISDSPTLAPAPASAGGVYPAQPGARRLAGTPRAPSPYLADGTVPVGDATLRRLTCDCRIHTITARGGKPVDSWEMQRTFSPRVERIILARDGGCRFPGCGRTRGLEIHHIRHWADGGRSEPSNGITYCRTHHWFNHELGWRVTGDPSGPLVFHGPGGRTVSAERAPPPQRE